MSPFATTLLLVAAIAIPALAQPKAQLNFALRDLAEPLQTLTPADQQAVDQAIKSIGRNEHVLALAYLNTLSAGNPANSAVRILRAWVLLEFGNAAGALEEARAVEADGVHSAYKCWFLAQVAYLAGDKPLCRREIKHLAGNSTYGPDAEKLRRDLK